MKETSILIIGASGGVGQATITRLKAYGFPASRLVLLDISDAILQNDHLASYVAEAQFIQQEVVLPHDLSLLNQLIQNNRIGIVVDVSELPCRILLDLCNALGVSYINTAATTLDEERVYDTMYILMDTATVGHTRPHILVSGMNPGIVNVWAVHGIKQFGVPESISLLEYDDSHTTPWHPSITWSPYQYLLETIEEPGGMMLGKRSPHHLGPNGLAHRQPMPDFFHGLYGLTDSVLACTTFHEECVSLAEQFNIPVSFRYAIDQRTMQYLVSHQGKPISSIPLRKVDNLQEQLQGADRIVVCLEYQDKRVVYENTTSNADISYTNATYHQVSAGVIAAIYTLLMRELPPKVYLPEELVSTVYADIIFALLPTRRIVTGSMDVDEVIAVRHQATRRKFEGLFQQMV